MIKEKTNLADIKNITAKKKQPSLRTISYVEQGNKKRVTIEQLKKLMRPIFEKKGILKALLFGSFARGTEDNKSDIDIFIIKNTNKRFLDRFEEFTELYYLLNDYAVDLLIYSPEELERNNHRSFIKTILSEGVALYER